MIAVFIKRTMALLLALLMLSGTALASKKATVYSDSMKVYKKASTSSTQMGSLKEGTTFYITSYNGTWAKISYKGYTGYAQLKDVKLAKSERAKAYTNKKTAVYRSASASSSKLGYVEKGSCIYIAGRNGNYIMCQNKSGSVTGYIHKDNLSWTKPAAETSSSSSASSATKAYTTRKTAVYKGSSSSSGKLGYVEKGTCIYVVDSSGDYMKCRNKSGTVTGYIDKDDISTTKPDTSSSGSSNTGSSDTTVSDSRAQMPSSLKSTTTSCSSSSSNSTKIEYVVYVAQNQLGKRYSTDPSVPKTFDCALLVYYCYKQAGVKLPASAVSQGYNDSYTKIENISDLKRGDMVVFNTNQTDGDLSDHTGIYIGSGKFIHASSGAGLVIVSDLRSGYYNRNFSWGFRIFN